MTAASHPDTPTKMGRPTLNVKETKVYLTDDLMARIKAVVGTYGMSKFIREAVERELERRESSPNGTPLPPAPP